MGVDVMYPSGTIQFLMLDGNLIDKVDIETNSDMLIQMVIICFVNEKSKI